MLQTSLKPSVVFLTLCYDQNSTEQFNTEARIRRSGESQDILLVICNSELECLMPILTVMWPQHQHSYVCVVMGSNLSNARHQFWTSHSELETKRFAFSMRLKYLNPNVPYVWMYTSLNSLVGMASGIFSCLHIRHGIFKGVSRPLCFAPQWQMAPIDLLS